MVEFTSTARERSDGVVQITVPALIRKFVKLNVPLKVTTEEIVETKPNDMPATEEDKQQ